MAPYAVAAASANVQFMNRSSLQTPGTKIHAFGVLFVLVLAMLLRSLVPAGYMPNPQASEHGNSLFVFCSPAGAQKVPQGLLALWADVAQSPDDTAIDDPCPFAVLGQMAMDTPEAGEAPVLSLIHATRVSPAIDDPALPAQGPRGPPLGSRAPPLFLA